MRCRIVITHRPAQREPVERGSEVDLRVRFPAPTAHVYWQKLDIDVHQKVPEILDAS